MAFGEIKFVQVEPDVWVAIITGQHRLRKNAMGNPPIRYQAALE